jgi:hypothetical protein
LTRAKERDRGVDEAVYVQGMDMTFGCHLVGKRQMSDQERVNVVGSRIVTRNDQIRRGRRSGPCPNHGATEGTARTDQDSDPAQSWTAGALLADLPRTPPPER